MLAIRPYREADRDIALGLFLELNRHEFTVSGDRRTDRGGAQFCIDDMIEDLANGVVAVVAEWDGAVCGLMVWAIKSDGDYVEEAFRRYGFIQDVVVARAYRGRGIGAALLAEAERLTRAAGLPRLKLTVLAGNDAAMDAYARAGYRDYARVMIKDLA